MNSLTHKVKNTGIAVTVVLVSLAAAYLLPSKPMKSFTSYTKERITLDSTYSAKKEQTLDSLGRWYEANAETLRVKYGMGR